MNVIQEILDFIAQLIQTHLWFAPFATFFMMVIEAIFPWLPMSVMISFSVSMMSSIYGSFLGTLYTVLLSISGSFLTMLAIFFLIRALFAKYFLKKVEDNKYGKKFLNVLENKNMTLALLLLCNPFLPSSIMNYALALTKVKLGKYIFLTLMSRIVNVLFVVFLGSIFNIQEKPLNVLWMMIAYFILFGIFAIFEYLRAKKRSKNAE
jgi:uncharacterized membrane protein YdjX (TVP38/TMEM64 family)